MPKYIAMGILSKRGVPYHPGSVITLTEEEAEKLGKKVMPAEVVDTDKPIDEMDLKELKALASAAKIKGYSRMSKGDLLKELTGVRSEAGVVDPAPEPEQVVVQDDTESTSG